MKHLASLRRVKRRVSEVAAISGGNLAIADAAAQGFEETAAADFDYSTATAKLPK